MTIHKQTPVLLITGYLGSGKTTLLNRLLNNRKGMRFAVIVNDIGEVNIDADLIARDGLKGNDDDSLVALQNGCICCTLKMDLVEQLTDLMEGDRFDYIVIEASGICEPEPIAQTICSMPKMGPVVNRNGSPRLDCIVTVVDALRLLTDFAGGDDIAPDAHGPEDLANLVAEQIEFCNIVVLNKISEVTPGQATRIKAAIRGIQPHARIIEADYADINFDDILDTHLFNFGRTAMSATWVNEIEKPADELKDEEEHHEHHGHQHEHHEHEHHDHHEHHGHHHHHDHDHGETEEYGISTFVYFRRDPFSLDKFDEFVAKHWPKNVIRTKGVVYFDEPSEMSYLFEQAGVQKKIQEAGLWLATAPEDELRAMAAGDPSVLRDWDDHYGDRMIKLVFIGRDLDKKAIAESLDKCLGRF